MKRESSFGGFVALVVAVYCVLFVLVQTPEPRHRPSKPPASNELQPVDEPEPSAPIEGFEKSKGEQRAFV
jgi:hypothetical protein